MKKIFFTLFLIFTFFIVYPQDTIHIPGDYTTIQAGINAASNGDLVLVEDGTYIENINFRGKAITVASHFIVDSIESHIENTIIDGSQPSHPDSGSVVTFNSGEDTTSVLCGFTITGGTGTYYPPQPPMPDSRIGGGIICHLSGARICHNKITSNVLTLNMGIVAGGGVSVVPPGNTSWIILEINTIVNNSIKGLFGGGGGAQLIANAKVLYNIIEYNTGDCTGENIWGGGLAMGSGDPNVTIPYERYIIGNTIRFNKVLATGNGKGFGGGLAVYTSPKAIIKYNNISYNEVQSSAALNKICYGGGVMLQNQNEETEFVNNYVAFNKALPNSICRGAGIALWGFAIPCSPYLYNNIITDNTNGTNGGGIFIGGLYVSEAKLLNNTFAQNSADYGGAVYSAQSNPLVSNSILWNNGSEIYLDGGTVTVEYSDVQGGWTGTGNINLNPELMDTVLTSGDTLFVCLPTNSPCVDAGNPDPAYNDSEDLNNLGYALFPSRGTLRNDMGAYGGPRAIDWIVTDVEEGFQFTCTIPDGFLLSQNYPNPFNPSTTIEFALPTQGFVTLSVYNILGEKVATLVNEEKLAGTYEAEFSSHSGEVRNLSSGIYFYQLIATPSGGQAGGYVNTKKMILLK